jgi:hypothetical protein
MAASEQAFDIILTPLGYRCTGLTMGCSSTLVGSVLAGSAITIGTNARLVGRAIAQTAGTCETVGTCETACTIETSGRNTAPVLSRLPLLPPLHQQRGDACRWRAS